MTSVHYFKYFCRCGEYLFDNAHIVANNTFLNRNYIFIKRSESKNIYIRGSNIVVCETCQTPLGGMIYRQYWGVPDLVRFVGHKVERQRIDISIHRIKNEYELEFSKGPLISRRYQQ